jgi:hypothetical protein
MSNNWFFPEPTFGGGIAAARPAGSQAANRILPPALHHRAQLGAAKCTGPLNRRSICLERSPAGASLPVARHIAGIEPLV